MTFRFADLVGRYRLVVTDALLEYVERAFVEPSPASDRERIRREALDEAKQSELLIDEDGTIASRSGDDEFTRSLSKSPPRLTAINVRQRTLIASL